MRAGGQRWTINTINFKTRIHFRFNNRLSVAIVGLLFSFAASAQSYPVSGVWVAMDNHFSGSKATVCLTLKTFRIDALVDESFPKLMIFADGKRYEAWGDYQAEETIRSIKSASDGGFRITESPRKHGRWPPWSKKLTYTLKIVDPMTIEITEGKVITQFFKCSSSRPSL